MALRLQAGTDEFLQQDGTDVLLLQDEGAAPTVTGSISVTLENGSADLDGVVHKIGDIASTLDSASSNFDGTFVAAAGVTGSISAALEDDGPNLDGTHTAPASRTGSVAATLEDAPGDLDGSHVAPVFTGSIGTVLEDATSDIEGLFYEDAPEVTGTINVTLDGMTGLLVAPPEQESVGGGGYETHQERQRALALEEDAEFLDALKAYFKAA